MALTVHVGLHKTGSTSLQAALGAAKGHIGRRQVYLPWTDLFLTDGAVNEVGAMRIRELGARGWHTVVSSEGALGPMSMSTVYPDAVPVARRLDELFANQDLRLVVYLRPQLEWAESAYAQYVRGGGTSHPRDFATTLRQQRYLRHTALVEDLRASVREGRLTVRPYRRGIDVVRDFFETARLGDVPDFVGEQWANVSPAPEAGDGRVRRSVLPEDCQVDLQTLFATDWAQLATVVASIPGHDPAEFRDTVEASRGWVPRPYVETVPRAPLVTRSAQATPSGTMPRRQRMAFRLRHGPRHMLLRSLTGT